MVPPPPPTLGELLSTEWASTTTPRSSTKPLVSPRGQEAALQPSATTPPVSPRGGKAALVSPSADEASSFSPPRSSFSFPILDCDSSSPMPLFSHAAQPSTLSALAPLASADEIKGSNPLPQRLIEKLKNEMIVVYYSVYNNDDFCIENIDNFINVLHTMKEIKLVEEGLDVSDIDVSQYTAAAAVPQETPDLARESKLSRVPKKFKCPVSNELMTDPVILSNGQTCERQNIEEYLKKGLWICPITNELLESDRTIPNCFARYILSEWCKENRIEYPEAMKDEEKKSITENSRSLNLQLARMNQSLTDKVEAAKVIRKLTKENNFARSVFGMCWSAIYMLLGPLKDCSAIGIFHLHEDIIAAVFHILAQDDCNKRELAKSAFAISLIVKSIKAGTISTSCHATAALLLLSTLDSNKPMIGKAGALKYLIELLDEGHPSAIHVASAAISKLCTADENIERAIEDGAVEVILKRIKARIFLDDLFDTLIHLYSHKNGLKKMHDCGAESILQSITDEELSKKTRKKCSMILGAVCYYANRLHLWKREEENPAEVLKNWTLSRRTIGVPPALRRSASL